MVHEISQNPEKYSYQERLEALKMKIKNYEVVDDGRNDEQEYAYWLN
jgi:hypothetical protein